MKTDSKGLVLKFSETLDAFLPIGHRSESEITSHFNGIPNRQGYIQAVIRACVSDYDKRVVPHGRALIQTGDPLAAELLDEEIFELCLAINPNLALDKASLPLQQEEKSQEPQTSHNHLKPELLKNLEETLNQHVVGQQEVISTVSQTLRQASSGLHDPNRPLASFAFAGSTGVGKTELAKAIAEHYFKDSSCFIRIDGSEYSLPHEAAKLIGSPPGYVGHEEGGQLTSQIQQLGQGVLLIDEIEKADTKVHNLLLQLLDEGRLTDSHGKTVSLRNFVIILTTNTGAQDIEDCRKAPGFARSTKLLLNSHERHQAVMRGLGENFSPEFLNRLDHILVFNELSENSCLKIVDLFLNQLNQRCQQLGFELETTTKLRKHLLTKSFNPKWGAREIRRQIKKFVEHPLSEKILTDDLKGCKLIADIKYSQAIFTFKKIA